MGEKEEKGGGGERGGGGKILFQGTRGMKPATVPTETKRGGFSQKGKEIGGGGKKSLTVMGY